ncbi:MAG: hypothetical protein ACSHX6_06490 [Akkermansiaceae bacterium]
MKTTPPFSSGGGGPEFERRIATTFIASSIAGVPLAPLKHPLNKVYIQAEHLGCKIEDVVFETKKNSQRSRCFCSVKTTISPLPGNTEFKEVITRSWADWNNTKVFNQSFDCIALIASTTRSPKIPDLLRLTEIARASDNNQDFSNSISIPQYHRKSIRQIPPEISAIIYEELGSQPSQENLWLFLKSFFVLTFDLDVEESQDKKRTLGLLRLASKDKLQSTALNCFNSIFEQVSQDTSRAKVMTLPDVKDKIREYDISPEFPDTAHNWLRKIREHSSFNRASISRTVGGKNFERTTLKKELKELLASSRFTLVTGTPGCGKSSLAVEVSEDLYLPENIYCFSSDQFNYPHLHTALEAIGLSEISPSEWADATPFENKVILIDSLERVFQSQSSFLAFEQLLQLISSDRRWHIIATCRDYYLPHIQSKWFEDWKIMNVPLLSVDELTQLEKIHYIPSLWLKKTEINEALRNLKWLDFALKTLESNDDLKNLDSWTSITKWKKHIWQHLVKAEATPQAHEFLIQLSLERLESGVPWFYAKENNIDPAKFLFDQGLLYRDPDDPNRYRSAHDLLEDWALISHVRRIFTQHKENPAKFFYELGSHTLIRRAFRYYFSELLDSSSNQDSINFIRKIFSDSSFNKAWKEEIFIALLSAEIPDSVIFHQSHIFQLEDASLFQELHHALKIAFIHIESDNENSRVPIGDGWSLLFEYANQKGKEFIRSEVKQITEALTDWHLAVTKETPSPHGLLEASKLTKTIWNLSAEDESISESILGKHYRTRDDGNQFYWIIAHLAEGLGKEFFEKELRNAVTWNKSKNRSDSQNGWRADNMIRFITTNHRGWALANAYPRLMIKLCLHAYGITRRAQKRRLKNRHYFQEHPYSIESLSFIDASAIRGPFLQLLQSSNKLGIALILRLVHEETLTWLDKVKNGTTYSEAYELEISIEETTVSQMGDQAWWRAYRGNTPCHPLTESALMALEKWLIEEVGATNPEQLETILTGLILSSRNLAITSVAASVAQVYWWDCTKITAAILESDFITLSSLDRHRLMNDRTTSGSSVWDDQSDIYFKERKMMSQMEHRRSDLENLFLKSQLTEKGQVITKVIDSHLSVIQKQPQSERSMLAKTILHRIDARNLVAKKNEGDPNHVLWETKAPPTEIQQFQEETAGSSIQNMAHIKLQMWAIGILEPMPSNKPDLELWKEMLERAHQLAESSLNSEEKFMHGDTPTLVAAVCIIHKWSEFHDKQKTWSIDLCLATLLRNSEITSHSQQHFLKQWKAESAVARAFATLLSIEDPICDKRKHNILSALSIALTLPEKPVQFAAAFAIGSSENEQLKTTSAALMILSARIIRNTELSFRGPLSQDSKYENWQDTLSAMHREILSETVNLRNQFIQQDSMDTRFLSLYYPRGHEEEERLCAVMAAVSSGESTIHRKLSSRIFKWAFIQTIAGESRSLNNRKYGMDEWRNSNGAIRHSYVTIKDVKQQLAKHILNLSISEAQKFLTDNFFKYQIVHLGNQAGSLLKDLCVQLDMTGKTEVFWAIWKQHISAAIAIWDDLSTSKSKKATSALYSIVESIFLNDMHFKKNQEWEAINNHLHNFSKAFNCFNLVGLSPFIRFLYTVGGDLLPSEWSYLAKTIALGRNKIGLNLLGGDIQKMLLTLLKDNIANQQIQKEDLKNWQSVRDILDFLIDLGHPEAYLIREQIARY